MRTLRIAGAILICGWLVSGIPSRTVYPQAGGALVASTPATPVPTPLATAAAETIPVVSPSIPPPTPEPTPIPFTCSWIPPSGGVLALEGMGPYHIQEWITGPRCVDFSGRTEWDRAFADQFAHPIRTLSGPITVIRYAIANGVRSWILPDSNYAR